MPDWRAIDARLAAARAFALSPAHREQVVRRSEQADVAGAGPALVAAVDGAVRADLIRRAMLADLAPAKQKPPAAPEGAELATIVEASRDELANVARLSVELRRAVEGIAGRGAFTGYLAGLWRVGRGKPLPDADDDATWTGLEDAALLDALTTVDQIALAARWAMPEAMAAPQAGHMLTRIVLAIRDALDLILPDGEARTAHRRSPAAPNGLLVQLVAVAIEALGASLGEVEGSGDLRKTVARILTSERDWRDHTGQN